MPVSRLPILLIILGSLTAATPLAVAADAPAHACLTKAEQHAAIQSHKVISLGQAMKAVRQRIKRAELVRARLCRGGSGLVYSLTLLGRSGKVLRVAVDAGSGELINQR